MKNSEKAEDRNQKPESDKKDQNLKYNPNVTEHDKDVLSQANVHGDGGDDQQLRDRKEKVDFEGEDLDVPGRNQAKKSNGNGLRDEENKLFSQGSENNENLEQDKPL